MNRKTLPIIYTALVATFLLASAMVQAQLRPRQYTERTLVTYNDTLTGKFLYVPDLYEQQWDTLAQPNFWKTVMELSGDSAVLNIAASRTILDVVAASWWSPKSDSWKDAYKDSVRKAYGLESDARIYYTSGKSFFYRIDKTLGNIHRALPVFDSMGVDPWYAQTILLIESPNSHNTSSSAGARGPFQLMKSVATKRGLIVNSRMDEREDLVKAGGAAAKLIRDVCIPETKRMLDARGITYQEDDLWFRLLVMHSYHAGAGNVKAALDVIKPTEGGIPLITQLWKTEAKGFRNASQNYSQVALASLLRLDHYLNSADTFLLLEGDRMFQAYKADPKASTDPLATMDACIELYEADLLENRTPFPAFLERVRTVEAEKTAIIEAQGNELKFKRYPKSQKHLNKIGYKLLRAKRFKDAIAAFQLNVDNHPKSWNAWDSLGEGYMKKGEKSKAIECYEKSLELNPKSSSGKRALEKLKG